MTTDADLRKLAEAVLDGSLTGRPVMADLADFHRAATADVVLSLLDRLAAAEKVVEAAREYCKAKDALDKVAYDTGIPTRIWVDAEKVADAAYAALAALDGEGKG